MSQVTIRVRANGPYVVEGPIEVVDQDGKPFRTTPSKPIALCRCGASQKKPFCDGAHRAIGFQSAPAANDQQ